MPESQPVTDAAPQPEAVHFGDLLAREIDRLGTPACVGLDPVYERLPDAVATGRPVESIEAFCLGVIRAVRGVVPVVKPQAACFERYGAAGYAALERVVEAARDAGLVVLLDAKRGDIGISSGHYAAGVSQMGAHAVTVNGYLGPSGIQPFLDRRLGVFVLVRTSNPDSDGVQGVRLEDGRTVAEAMAEMVRDLGAGLRGASGLSGVGAVIGATKAGAELERLRSLLPDAPVLVPGVGAQGGRVEDLAGLRRSGGRERAGAMGVLVTAGRSVIYPEAPAGAAWEEAVRAAAEAFAEECRRLAAP